MNVFRFLDWKVYVDAKELFKLVNRIVSRMPAESRRHLGSQVIRSSFSVALNISEGSGKNLDGELNRFFDISLGSLNETVAGLDMLRDNKLVSESEFREVLEKARAISMQIGCFKESIRRVK